MTEYLICWFITFGFAFSVALTDGPGGLFKMFRNAVKLKYGAGHWFSIGVGCPICLSFYLGLIVALCNNPSNFVALWLSSFGFVSVVTSLSPDE